MAVVGVDCQVALDGTGYFVVPGSYRMLRPRVRKAQVVRGVAQGHGGVPERYVDRGPGKREWHFTAQCLNALRRYDGTALGDVGQALRDALHLSYERVGAVLSFTDVEAGVWSVLFDDLVEVVDDVRAQAIVSTAPGVVSPLRALGYLCEVVLVEA